MKANVFILFFAMAAPQLLMSAENGRAYVASESGHMTEGASSNGVAVATTNDIYKNGFLVTVTNTVFEKVAAEPHGLTVKVTYFPDKRLDSSGSVTNGSVLAEGAGSSPHNYTCWVTPRRPHVFKLVLRDDTGTASELTDQGKSFGVSITKLKGTAPPNMNFLLFTGTNDVFELGHFDIDDVFVIRHSGRYELEMTPQACWGSTLDQEFYLTNLPPIKMNLVLKANHRACCPNGPVRETQQ